MTVVTSNVCKWAVYNLTLWKPGSAWGGSTSYLNGFQKETQCTCKWGKPGCWNPKVEHWSESNGSPSSHKPGLNWILTPASFWIFLIISPFLPITIPTANLGTETWWERQRSMKAQRTRLNDWFYKEMLLTLRTGHVRQLQATEKQTRGHKFLPHYMNSALQECSLKKKKKDNYQVLSGSPQQLLLLAEPDSILLAKEHKAFKNKLTGSKCSQKTPPTAHPTGRLAECCEGNVPLCCLLPF